MASLARSSRRSSRAARPCTGRRRQSERPPTAPVRQSRAAKPAPPSRSAAAWRASDLAASVRPGAVHAAERQLGRNLADAEVSLPPPYSRCMIKPVHRLLFDAHRSFTAGAGGGARVAAPPRSDTHQHAARSGPRTSAPGRGEGEGVATARAWLGRGVGLGGELGEDVATVLIAQLDGVQLLQQGRRGSVGGAEVGGGEHAVATRYSPRLLGGGRGK